MRRSDVKRSSSNKSMRRSKRSIKLRDGSIICGKCVGNVGYKRELSKPRKRQSRKTSVGVLSPTHATEVACKANEDRDINQRVVARSADVGS